MIYMNQNMKKIIKDIEEKKGRISKKNCELNSLMQILWPNFIEIEDCIFLSSEIKDTKKINLQFMLKMFGDRTGIEASHSHLHMMDIINEFSKRPRDGFRFSLELMELWACKLKSTFPNYTFHIILSFDGKDSIIRFYRLRNNEPTWCDKNNLEAFKTALLIKEF